VHEISVDFKQANDSIHREKRIFIMYEVATCHQLLTLTWAKTSNMGVQEIPHAHLIATAVIKTESEIIWAGPNALQLRTCICHWKPGG